MYITTDNFDYNFSFERMREICKEHELWYGEDITEYDSQAENIAREKEYITEVKRLFGEEINRLLPLMNDLGLTYDYGFNYRDTAIAHASKLEYKQLFIRGNDLCVYLGNNTAFIINADGTQGQIIDVYNETVLALEYSW